MSKLANLYRGRAGQLAVMSEFLDRGYNVAVPEVDIGDDIFVVHDSKGDYWRIQVKASIVRLTKKGSSAQYSLRHSKLAELTVPETWYVFVQRLGDRWHEFMVIRRAELFAYHDDLGMGTVNKKGYLSLYVKSDGERRICSGVDLSRHVNDWSYWPPISQ